MQRKRFSHGVVCRLWSGRELLIARAQTAAAAVDMAASVRRALDEAERVGRPRDYADAYPVELNEGE